MLEWPDALETFLHNDSVRTPLLIKAALAHVQFETIHPFLDGNGRLGRLLITFLFCAEGALREPLLYVSLYFKQPHQLYYDLLQSVRLTSDWEAWLRFFLTGVEETANQAGQTAKALINSPLRTSNEFKPLAKPPVGLARSSAEAAKEDYYYVLQKSSHRWHDSKHDLLRRLNHYLAIARRAYGEFEQRAGDMRSRRGAKTELAEHAIEASVGDFSIEGLERACPGVSRDMIRLLLRDLKAAGRIEGLGRGPGPIGERG